MQFFSACKACTHVVCRITIISCKRQQFVELDVDWRYRVIIYFHAIAQNFRDHYVGQSHFSRDSIFFVRIITCPTITRYAIRWRLITRVSPLIGISQDRKMVREKKREKHLYGGTLERAWVLARYDAIMRYEHRRGSGEGAEGDRAGEKKRDGENRMREQEKKKPDKVTERSGGGGRWSCRTDLD